MSVWGAVAADGRTLYEWFRDGEEDGIADSEKGLPLRVDWVSYAKRDLSAVDADAAVAYAKGYVAGWKLK